MSAIDEAADWRSRGACLSADPDLFFPISPGGASQRQEKRAKAVCATCPVKAECLAFAVETRQVHGVWGGLGEEELARLGRSLRAPGAVPQRIPGTGRVADRGRVAGATKVARATQVAGTREAGGRGPGHRDREPEPQAGLCPAAGGTAHAGRAAAAALPASTVGVGLLSQRGQSSRITPGHVSQPRIRSTLLSGGGR